MPSEPNRNVRVSRDARAIHRVEPTAVQLSRPSGPDWKKQLVIMHLRAAFGVLAVAAGALVACGDKGEDANAAGGTGGAAGSGGSSAVAGAAGSVGGSAGDDGAPSPPIGSGGCGASPVSPLCGGPGTAGTAGNSADAPDAGDAGSSDASDGPSEPCTGCLELRATVTNNDDSAFFQIVYGSPVDMSAAGATITFHVSGLAPEDDVRVSPFIYDSDYAFAPGDSIELIAADGFIDIVLELDELTDGALDKSDVIHVGLLVGYTGGIGAESSQNLALLLDSVTFSGADTPDLAFTTDNESFDRSEIGVQATEVVHR